MCCLVAFRDEVSQTVTFNFIKIPDDSEADSVVGKLLEDFSRQFIFQVKEIRRQVFS